jgi:16S rRNA (cytosine967-C5)-methyltransferase
VKPGGRLVYVTCSVLLEENDDVIAAFLAANPGWTHRRADAVVRATLPDVADPLFASVAPRNHGLQMTPRRTGVDGFYVAVLERDR